MKTFIQTCIEPLLVAARFGVARLWQTPPAAQCPATQQELDSDARPDRALPDSLLSRSSWPPLIRSKCGGGALVAANPGLTGQQRPTQSGKTGRERQVARRVSSVLAMMDHRSSGLRGSADFSSRRSRR